MSKQKTCIFMSIGYITSLMNKGLSYNRIEALNQKVSVEGVVIGGNLTLFESLIASPFQANYSKKIILLEETDVNYQQLDRSLNHLLMLKEFDQVNAVIFGQFYSMDATDEQRLIYKKVIENFAKKFKKPVFYYPLFGHGFKNKPFIFNKNAVIHCKKSSYFCDIKQ